MFNLQLDTQKLLFASGKNLEFDTYHEWNRIRSKDPRGSGKPPKIFPRRLLEILYVGREN